MTLETAIAQPSSPPPLPHAWVKLAFQLISTYTRTRQDSPRIPSFFLSRYVLSTNADLKKKWVTWTTVSWIKSMSLSPLASGSAQQKASLPLKPLPQQTSLPPSKAHWTQGMRGREGCEDEGTRGDARGRGRFLKKAPQKLS